MLVVSIIRPCEFETYLLEITITSPFSKDILFFERALVNSSNKTKFPFCRFALRGITVNDTTSILTNL